MRWVDDYGRSCLYFGDFGCLMVVIVGWGSGCIWGGVGLG